MLTKTHQVTCEECQGEGGHLGYSCCGGQGCGANGLKCWRDCETCDGEGDIEADIDPECGCGDCQAAFWVWANNNDHWERFECSVNAMIRCVELACTTKRHAEVTEVIEGKHRVVFFHHGDASIERAGEHTSIEESVSWATN